jgi:two-component system NtrC family sensor kinase
MKWPLLVFFFLLGLATQAQSYLDSLHDQLKNAKTDTAIIDATGALAQCYTVGQIDSAIYYAKRTLDLAEKFHYPYGMYLGYRSIYAATNSLGDYPKALEWAIKELKIAEGLKSHRLASMAWAYFCIGLVNREMKYFPEAKMHFTEAMRLQKESGEPIANIHDAYSHLAVVYLLSHQLDSALAYAQRGCELSAQSNTFNKIYASGELAILGNVEHALGHNQLAEKYYRLGIEQAKKNNILYFEARLYNNLAAFFNKMNKPDSCVFYSLASLQICQQFNYPEYALDASKNLTQFYESRHNSDSSLKYMKLMLAAKDAIFSQQKVQQFQLLGFDEKQRQQEIEAAEASYRNRLRIYSLLAIIGVFFFVAIILYRNNVQRKKINTLLQNQKQELETALTELKSTQSQLIQSEKMASLTRYKTR